MKIGFRLTILFVLIGVISVSLIGYFSYSEGKKSLTVESFNRLTAVREMKAGQIEDYFKQIESQIVTYSKNKTVVEAMSKFKKGFKTLPNQYNSYSSKNNKEQKDLENYYKDEFLPRLNSNSLQTHNEADFKIQNEAGAILQNIFIASNPNPVGEKQNLAFIENDTLDYVKTHNEFHSLFKDYLERFGFYDIFLIDNKSGDIVYSVFKEVDFGTSLKNGAFSNTNFSKVYDVAIGSNDNDFVGFVDFEPYIASYNAHAAFMSTPIFDGKECIGVLVFQMPIDRINEIMTNRQKWKEVGLGETGETYLVSDDYTLRSQSRFFIEDRQAYFETLEKLNQDSTAINKIKMFESCIGLQTIKTEGTMAAMKGEVDTRLFKDYRGEEVLSSFKPLKISGVNWVIMSEIDKVEAFRFVEQLRNKIWFFFPLTIIIILIISFFAAKTITKPIKSLTKTSRELARGNLDVEVKVERKDEIGILALSFKSMQSSLHKLIEDLQESNHTLEDKVEERTEALSLQKEVIEEKNKEIVDSIQYALRLQNAILPSAQNLQDHLKDHFILFKPKDIVSGDFYWMTTLGDKIIIAVADCTGHGVPGAMLSIIGANGLNRCVKEFKLTKPSTILEKLREIVIETFESTSENVQDGMDISILCFDVKSKEVEFSGANNPLWIARKRDGVMEIIKGDKQPVGQYDYSKSFTNHKIRLHKGDCFYLFTDGFADQFGGEKGKKLKYKPFQELLLKNIHLLMHEQKQALDKSFVDWTDDFEQVDDVCVVGIKI